MTVYDDGQVVEVNPVANHGHWIIVEVFRECESVVIDWSMRMRY